MKNLNFYLIEFALNSIFRQKGKNIFIFTLLTLLVFLVTSFFQIATGLKSEAIQTVDTLPQITIQKLQGGRTVPIEIAKVDELLQINGVKSAVGRVWGYYYFANQNIYFTIIGIDQFEEQTKKTFEEVTSKYNFDEMKNGMIIGKGVEKILKENSFEEYFNFIKSNGEVKRVSILGTFHRDTTLETNDVMLVPQSIAYEILELQNEMATDIVVKVENIEEIDTIAAKIKTMFPMCRVITKEELKRSYENMFHYKSGLFLALFTICLFSFFMIIYDKSSGLHSSEKKEIGILKAVGWSTNDILKWKFYEAVIVSKTAFFCGLILSFFYVYILKAPLLKDLFLGNGILKPEFNIPFIFDIESLAMTFFITVPIYVAATIFPSWRVSITEADEVLR